MDVIISKTFDNGTECPSEQTLVIDREIADDLLAEFKRLGCYICKPEEVEKITEVAIDARTGGMNYRAVGQSANFLAEMAGLDVLPDTKIIICPLEGELRNHKLAVEKLMPLLGYVLVDSVNEGINRALDVNYAGGTGHTAGIFSEDESVVEQFATAINAGRIIVNSPCCIGGLGGIYNNLNTTLSFGCGTGGGNITSDNVGIKNLLNYKRVPKRTNFTLSFHTTKNIYINPGSLDHLRSLKTKSAVIITTPSASKRGHLSLVTERLPQDCVVSVFNEIGEEPDIADVEQALIAMRRAQPDTIIALGGGSVMDAAKIIRLFYDYPDIKLSEMAVNFLDFRHRMVEFPQKMNTTLVAIPTTSGTGSEVTPFAVLKDKANSRKLSLVDDCMMPDWAIIDANLTKSMPKSITVDTAFDALTHALEALVSTFASDYTDGLALESMRLIFEALPQTLLHPNNIVWRHKMHNASTLAGMAIGNASVGINHALAHSLGAVFDVPHGRANGVFLLSTLEYNSCIPRKFMPTSTYAVWVADQKYARAAQFLGLIDPGPSESEDHLTAREKEDARCKRLNVLLRRAVYDLAKACDQPTSISQLNVSEDAFEAALPALVKSSFTDMSLRTNPSLPLLSEVSLLMMSAYPERERP